MQSFRFLWCRSLGPWPRTGGQVSGGRAQAIGQSGTGQTAKLAKNAKSDGIPTRARSTSSGQTSRSGGISQLLVTGHWELDTARILRAAVSREPNIGEAGLQRRGGSGRILLLGAMPACGRITHV
jgi:hypothetical protein